jgi:glycosyltransferase involved in cell wall biosynthesis
MSLPKISIVTPSYNQGAFLEETIRSVIDQGYPNLEYIIIDGGSTDNSVDVIRKYEKHLAYWVSERDRGQTDALNKGIKRCTGDVFGFINSDDFLYPKSLSRIADTWAEGARWMVGWSIYLELGGSNWPYLKRPTHSKSDWFLWNPIPQQSTFFARSFFDEIGPFREDLHYSFDYEYWMRMRFQAQAKLVVIRQCLAAFRYHDASKTVALASKFGAEDQKIWDEYRKYLSPRDRLQLSQARRRMRAGEALDRMWRAINAHDAPAARREALVAAGQRPLSIESWKGLYFALKAR